MSRIDELIQQLCPDGVEYKPLGDIMQIRRGASPRPIQEYITKQDDGIPWIKIGDVNPRSKFIVKTDQKITVSGAKKSCYLKKGDFILSNSMSFGRPYILAIDGCIHDGWIAMSNFERSFNSDFLFYLLRTQMIQKFWRQKASSGTVQNLNSDIVRDTSVPVPPLPVQEEIVRILDKFTALEAELEAELEARRKQYEFYRDQLLTFGDEVEWRPLGEIGDFTYGYTAKAQNQGDVRFIRITDIGNNGCLNKDDVKYITLSDESKKYLLKVGDLLVARTGATFGKTLIITSSGKYVYASFLIKITLDSNLIGNKFYWHFSKSKFYWKQALKLVSASSQPQFNTGALKKILVPVPPLAEQERIVAILDKFDALVNDISSGLPAELEMRRKQYEYYRDRLLTFKPLAKEA